MVGFSVSGLGFGLLMVGLLFAARLDLLWADRGLVDTDVVMCVSGVVNWLICCTCWLGGLWLCVVVYFVVVIA